MEKNKKSKINFLYGRLHTEAYNPVLQLATNTRTDNVSMDVIWRKVLQVYLRCHWRGGTVTLLRGVGRFHRFRCPQSFSVTPGTDRPM